MTIQFGREEILEYLQHHRERLSRQYSLESIGLFGSIARSSYTLDSDVDLIVRFLPGTRHIHALKSALQTELQEVFGRPVQIASEKYLKPYYRSEILKETLYV